MLFKNITKFSCRLTVNATSFLKRDKSTILTAILKFCTAKQVFKKQFQYIHKKKHSSKTVL